MKIRSDFVTNSSSSSFIIGRHDDDITVDAVFNIMKGLYQDYLDKRDALKADWLSCKNYKEYEECWLNKFNEAIESNDKTNHPYAPFSIADFSKCEDFYALEDGTYCLEQKKSVKASESDIFGWYIGCSDALFGEPYYKKIDGQFYDEDGNIVVAKSKEHCDWCYYTRRNKVKDFTCNQIIQSVKDGKITDENAIAMVLGKICIMSECGWIPDRIVDKLGEMSRFYCNHMG